MSRGYEEMDKLNGALFIAAQNNDEKVALEALAEGAYGLGMREAGTSCAFQEAIKNGNIAICAAITKSVLRFEDDILVRNDLKSIMDYLNGKDVSELFNFNDGTGTVLETLKSRLPRVGELFEERINSAAVTIEGKSVA